MQWIEQTYPIQMHTNTQWASEDDADTHTHT